MKVPCFSSSDPVLSRNVIVSLSVVNQLFPEITQETSTGLNLTAVGNPKTTRSVIYASSDDSKKVTITVDRPFLRKLICLFFKMGNRSKSFFDIFTASLTRASLFYLGEKRNFLFFFYKRVYYY